MNELISMAGYNNAKSLKDLPDIEKFISDEEKNQIVDDEINMEIEDENK